jgi:2-phosphosulfolactate phosphatase
LSCVASGENKGLLNLLRKGKRSPEAEAAVAAFYGLKDNLAIALRQCSSGKELIARGFVTDIELAADINSSSCIPLLTNSAYIKAETVPPNRTL